MVNDLSDGLKDSALRARAPRHATPRHARAQRLVGLARSSIVNSVAHACASLGDQRLRRALMPSQRDGVALLVPLLSARRPLLLAGAGASASMGYPLWDDLVQRLKMEFAPALTLSDDNLASVDEIALVAADAGRADEYLKWLDLTFCFDGARWKDLRFHRQLISLGFCGLITSNFDPTLEHACITEYSSAACVHSCQSVDLTDNNRRYLVFEFLRRLGGSPQHDGVLHLHGFHSAPDRLILGSQDYASAYGHDLSARDAELRTLPRKTVWTLLATRPVLFVGFSMTDPFFNKTLELVRSDFILTDEPAHFAIIPYDVDLNATAGMLDSTVAHEEAKRKIRHALPRCLVPIFYHAPRVPGTARADHSQLAGLIDELGARAGMAPRAESPVDRLTRRALQEL